MTSIFPYYSKARLTYINNALRSVPETFVRDQD